jgi:uncharacterized protein YbaR (Trm112 family)
LEMLTCPLCKTELAVTAPRCPRCQTDITLLADFVTDLKTLLDKADTHRRAGEIAPAVQAYLDVLEVDPANAEAREALGPVLRAMRTINVLGQTKQRFAVGLFAVLVLGIAAIAFMAGFAWNTWR